MSILPEKVPGRLAYAGALFYLPTKVRRTLAAYK